MLLTLFDQNSYIFISMSISFLYLNKYKWYEFHFFSFPKFYQAKFWPKSLLKFSIKPFFLCRYFPKIFSHISCRIQKLFFSNFRYNKLLTKKLQTSDKMTNENMLTSSKGLRSPKNPRPNGVEAIKKFLTFYTKEISLYGCPFWSQQ